MANRRRPDSAQLDLLGGLGGASAEVERVFLALMPDDATRAALARVAQSLRDMQPNWRARWTSPARYHITLHFLGEHQGPRPALLAAVREAANRVDARTFEWTLDQADSFHGQEPPLVLRSAGVAAPMHALWEQWRRGLILAGQGAHLARSHAPHVTLAYGLDSRRQASSIEPLSWQANEVALIRSVAGRPHYETLASWPLA